MISAPDLPIVKQHMTPKDLRVIISRLENNEVVKKEADGFYKLVDAIDDVVDRIPSRKTCIAVQLGDTPYGNPMVKGQFKSDSVDFPRTDLIEWRVLRQELARRRDKFRYIGLSLFLLGFLFQALSYLC